MKRMITAADRGDALIGIYWYTDDGKVFGFSQPTDDGILDGQYIQYDGVNHLSGWRQAVKDSFSAEQQEEIISKGFKSIYRGRCIYDTMTTCYVITCSKDLLNSREFRNAVKSYFNLSQVRVEFKALSHYENKLELTGNPAVDDLYFDV